MASSTATLDLISVGQAGKEKTANDLLFALSPALLFARRPAACIGLTWAFYGGRYGAVDVANGSVTLTVNATNFIQANAAGVVSVNTSGFDPSKLALYTVTVDAGGATTAYSDQRQAIGASGSGGGAGGAFALSAATTDATPTAMLDASASEITLPTAGALYGIKGTIVAADTVTADSSMWEISALMRYISGSAALIGTASITQVFNDSAASTWTIALSATTSTRTMHVVATGEASKAISWSANLSATVITPLSGAITSYTYDFSTTAGMTTFAGASLAVSASKLHMTWATGAEVSVRLDSPGVCTNATLDVDVEPIAPGDLGSTYWGFFLRTATAGFGIPNGPAIFVYFYNGSLYISRCNNGTSGPGNVNLLTATASLATSVATHVQIILAGTSITVKNGAYTLGTATIPSGYVYTGYLGLWGYSGAASPEVVFSNLAISGMS